MKRQLPGLADAAHDDSRPEVPDGILLTNLDGFAPASQWERLSTSLRSIS